MVFTRTVQAVENSPLTLGKKVLHNFGIQKEAHWYWTGIAALLGFTVLLNVVYALSLAYLNRKQLDALILRYLQYSFKTFMMWGYY